MIEPANTRGALPVWIHAGVWGLVAVLIVILFIFSRAYEGQHVWDGWRESRDLHHSGYAERIYSHDLFRTRANTWSNLAYVIIGLYGIAIGCHDLRRPRQVESGYLIQTPAMSLLFGVACCSLGAGSGFFHASLTRAGQQLDVATMYAPLLSLIALNVGRWVPSVPFGALRSGRPTWPILCGLAVVVTLLLYFFKWSMSARSVLTTLIAIVSIFTSLDRSRTSRKMTISWLLLAGVALIAGVACRELDVAGRFTGPDAWLQGHAFWHTLTALSLGCMYLYYRSETVPNP